jgi:hypothetical protein
MTILDIVSRREVRQELQAGKPCTPVITVEKPPSHSLTWRGDESLTAGSLRLDSYTGN